MCEYLDLYLHFWMIVLLGREFLVDIFFSFIISICLWAAVVSYEKMAIFALSLMNRFSFAIFKSLFLLILTHTIYDVYVGVFNGPAGIWDSVSPSIYVCISPASSLSLLPIDFSGFFFFKDRVLLSASLKFLILLPQISNAGITCDCYYIYITPPPTLN